MRGVPAALLGGRETSVPMTARRSPRILFIGMSNSVHAARWTNAIADEGWDLHFFPVYDAPLHPLARNVTLFGSSRLAALHERAMRLYQLAPTSGRGRLLAGIARQAGAESSGRSSWLAFLISWLKPDIVHTMEMQHSAYMVMEARDKLARWRPRTQFPPWIVSNWGSDIFLYGRLDEHAGQIRRVLAACDYYHCECERDVELARTFGFKGTVLPVLPIGGGFELDEMQRLRQPGPVSARRWIAMKGYQSWAGRAQAGLRAIERCADVLADYRIGMYLLHPPDNLAAIERVSRLTGIEFEYEPAPYAWGREQVLTLLGRSRISIGLSISDAISTSMLEAMILGAFPVQSHTGCQDEWVEHGQTALFVHPEDPESIEVAIRRAVTDDRLVDEAAARNAEIAAERLDDRIIQPQVVDLYKQVFAGARGDRIMPLGATGAPVR
jgi:glycosyltransferase involved in cell wall biosynthesis